MMSPIQMLRKKGARNNAPYKFDVELEAYNQIERERKYKNHEVKNPKNRKEAELLKGKSIQQNNGFTVPDYLIERGVKGVGSGAANLVGGASKVAGNMGTAVDSVLDIPTNINKSYVKNITKLQMENNPDKFNQMYSDLNLDQKQKVDDALYEINNPGLKKETVNWFEKNIGGYNTAKNVLDNFDNAFVGDTLDVVADTAFDVANKIAPSGYDESKLNPITKFAGNVAHSIGNMAPSLAAGAVTGSPDVALGVMGANAFGSGVNQAQSEGANLENSFRYGLANAVTELATEKLTGGIAGFGAGITDDFVSGVIAKMTSNPTTRKIFDATADLLGEATEEYVAELVGEFLPDIYKNDKENISASQRLADVQDEALMAGLAGMASAGVLNAPSYIANMGNSNVNNESNINTPISENNANKPINVANNDIDSLVNRETLTSIDGNIAMHAQELNNQKIDYQTMGTNLNKETVENIKRISNNVGIPIEFVELDADINGMYVNGKIVLNKNTSEPINTIFAHELTHAIEGTESYSKLEQAIYAHMQASGIENVEEAVNIDMNNYIDVYAKHGVELSTEGAKSEVIAHYIQNNIANDSFINSISGDTKLMHRIINWLNDFITNLAGTKEQKAYIELKNKYKQALNEIKANTKVTQDGMKYSISKTFKENIRDIAKNKYMGSSYNALEVRSNTPDILKNLGLNDYPVLMTLSHAKNALGIGTGKNQHLLDVSVLENIDKLIENPIAIYEKNGNLNALLRATDKNNNIIEIAIKPNGKGYYNNIEIDSNFLLTAFGKENIIRYYEKIIDKTKILYPANAQKNQLISEIIRYQSSNHSTISGKYSISDNNENVNSDNLRADGSKKDLMAIHNLSADKLKKVNKLGGFAMPSIAITKDNISHDNFGDISLVMNPDSINPQKSSSNKIYNRDSWTPEYPKINFQADNITSSSIISDVKNMIAESEYIKEFGNDTDINKLLTDLAPTNLNDYANKSNGIEGITLKLKENNTLKLLYAETNGYDISPIYTETNADIEKYNEVVNLYGGLNNLIKNINNSEFILSKKSELENIFGNNLSEGKINLLLRKAIRKVQEGNKYVLDLNKTISHMQIDEGDFLKWINDSIVNKLVFKETLDNGTTHNLNNVVNSMKSKKQIGVGNIFSGLGPLISKKSTQFNNLNEVISNENKITADSLEDLETNVINEFNIISDSILKNNPNRYSTDLTNVITDVLSETDDPKMIIKLMKKYGNYNVTESQALQLKEFNSKLSDINVNYFEAKPQRAVMFDEINTAVIPDNTDQSIIDILNNRGVKTKTYNPNIEGDRQRVVNSIESAKFSISDDKLSPKQKEFFSNSKVVDENGNLKVYYNGSYNFNIFDNTKFNGNNKFGKGIYLTSDKKVAANYGTDIKEVFVNITNPISNNEKTVSFEQYNNLVEKITGEEAYKEDYDLYDNDMDLLWDITDKGQWSDYADELKEATGKDGIIDKDMIVAFDSSQLKRTNNINPTYSKDIRYSINDEQKQINKISKQNPEFKEIINNFNNNVFGRNDSNMNVLVNAATSEIINNGKISDTTKNELKDYIYKEAGYEDSNSIKNEVISYLRGTSIVIPRGESRMGSTDNTFELNKIAPRGIHFTNNKAKGTSMDSLWMELGENFGYSSFPQDIVSTGDQVNHLMELFASKPSIQKYNKMFSENEFKELINKDIDDFERTINQSFKNKDVIKKKQAKNILTDKVKSIAGYDNTYEKEILPAIENNDYIDPEEYQRKRMSNVEKKADDVKSDILNIVLAGKDAGYLSKTIEQNMDVIANGNKTVENSFRKTMLEPFFEHKTTYAKETETRIKDVYNKIVKELGIRKGSKESAAIMWYGEGRRIKPGKSSKVEYETYTEQDLIKDFPISYRNIIKATNYMRNMYDEYITRINSSLEEIYPTDRLKDMVTERKASYEAKIKKAQAKIEAYKASGNPNGQPIVELMNKIKNYSNEYNNAEDYVYKNRRLTPRKDYFTHLSEISTMESLKALLKNESPAGISNELATMSAFTKPKARWMGFMQHRGNNTRYIEDAVGGILDYIPKAEYKINIDPYTAYMRGVIKNIVETSDNVQVSNTNLINYLSNFTNDLAGKTDPITRALYSVMNGRRIGQWLLKASQRPKANAILGNVGSALAQFYNLPNGIALLKQKGGVGFAQDIAQGNKYQMADMLNNSNLISQSGFITERYLDKHINKFDDGVLQKPKAFATWMLTVGDETVAKNIWYSAYSQAERLKVDNPISYADEITRRAVAGRGVGEVPIAQKNIITKLMAPFQVEVNNTWQLQKQLLLGKDKDPAALMLMFVTIWLMNNIKEELTGSRTGMDIIDSVSDAYKGIKDGSMTIGQALGRQLGEVVGNIPWGAQMAMFFLNNDTEREQFFGEADPTRYGVGNIGVNAITDPLLDLINGRDVDLVKLATQFGTPWGGKQIERIIKFAQDTGQLPKISTSQMKIVDAKNGAYNNSGQLKYVPDKDLYNQAKGYLFGTYATKEGKEYIDKGYKALSDNKTNTYQGFESLGISDQQVVDILRELGQLESDKDSDGKSIKNSKAEKAKGLWEEAGLYDEVLKLIESGKYEPKDFGITKDVYSGKSKTSKDEKGNDVSVTLSSTQQKAYNGLIDEGISDEDILNIMNDLWTENKKDEYGNSIKNSKAQANKEIYEEAGLYDEVLNLIASGKYEASDFGLNKTVTGTKKTSNKKTSRKYANVKAKTPTLSNNFVGNSKTANRKYVNNLKNYLSNKKVKKIDSSDIIKQQIAKHLKTI